MWFFEEIKKQTDVPLRLVWEMINSGKIKLRVYKTSDGKHYETGISDDDMDKAVMELIK